MNIETRPIDSLTLDPENARLHPERNKAAIRDSLNRYGQQKPIVVDSNGVIRAGNGVYTVAKEMGWEQLQVVVSDLSDAELRAFAIADNRAGELSEWDEDALTAALKTIAAESGAEAPTGFSSEEVSRLLQVAAFDEERGAGEESTEPAGAAHAPAGEASAPAATSAPAEGAAGEPSAAGTTAAAGEEQASTNEEPQLSDIFPFSVDLTERGYGTLMDAIRAVRAERPSLTIAQAVEDVAALALANIDSLDEISPAD